MKRADTVVFDPDVVADFHTGQDFRALSDDNPYLEEIEALRDKIRSAAVKHWEGRGYTVYPCPEWEVSSDVAAGRLDADDIYAPSEEEWESAAQAAWDDADLGDHYPALVQRVREWEESHP